MHIRIDKSENHFINCNLQKYENIIEELNKLYEDFINRIKYKAI